MPRRRKKTNWQQKKAYGPAIVACSNMCVRIWMYEAHESVRLTAALLFKLWGSPQQWQLAPPKKIQKSSSPLRYLSHKETLQHCWNLLHVQRSEEHQSHCFHDRDSKGEHIGPKREKTIWLKTRSRKCSLWVLIEYVKYQELIRIGFRIALSPR